MSEDTITELANKKKNVYLFIIVINSENRLGLNRRDTGQNPVGR